MYKRQIQHPVLEEAHQFLDIDARLDGVLPAGIEKVALLLPPVQAVSYTHLDVYKRQAQDLQGHHRIQIAFPGNKEDDLPAEEIGRAHV